MAYVEAREEAELLLDAAVVLLAEVAEEFLLGIGGVSGILAGVLHLGPLLVELGAGQAEHPAELHGVEVARLAGSDHEVVGRLVEYHQASVAVVDETAHGVQHLLEEGIAVGVLAVCVVAELESEEAHHVDQDYHYDEACHYVAPPGEFIVFAHYEVV